MHTYPTAVYGACIVASADDVGGQFYTEFIVEHLTVVLRPCPRLTLLQYFGVMNCTSESTGSQWVRLQGLAYFR